MLHFFDKETNQLQNNIGIKYWMQCHRKQSLCVRL